LTVVNIANIHAAILNCDYAATTRYTALSGLKQLLGQLIASGAPYTLLSVLPRPTRPAPRPNTVTEEELAFILSNAEPYMQLFVLLCHDTALRANTAANVAWCHLTGDHSMLTIRTKRQSVVRIPVSGRIVTLLETCPAGNMPLCSLLYGRHLCYNALYIKYKALLSRIGLPPSLWLHDLRRTMAEQTYNVSGDLRVVQTLLGHGNLSSTLHYLQRPAQTHMDALAASIESITGRAHD
jgi:integrase